MWPWECINGTDSAKTPAASGSVGGVQVVETLLDADMLSSALARDGILD
jgi:hypothetical protein